jgi:hypothetical protein
VETSDTLQQRVIRLVDSEVQLPPIANPTPPPDVRSFRVYHFQGTYFVPSSKGGWYPTNEKGAKQYLLKNHGIRGDRIMRDDALTQIDDVMLSVRDLNSVSWVGSCGGVPPQLMSANGKDILILEGPKLIQPAKGDFPIIKDILLNLLGAEQLEFFDGWMKWGRENLEKAHRGKEGRPGQFVALVGPRGGGKNLVQERIITPVLGGRVAKPTHFFNDRTNFNGDLVGAEHWLLSDETPARDIDSRRAFGNHIKQVAANSEVRTEIKFGHPIVLRPFRRGTVSLNDEDENIRTLPPMDDSIEDKLMIFKCNFVKLPLPSGEAIEAATASELPAYVHYLLHEHAIREELRDDRFGVKAHHHPAVLEALSATTPQTQLFQEIDRAEPFNRKSEGFWIWEGSSSRLQEILEIDAEIRGYSARTRMASLLKYGNTCGTYLSRLAKERPDRVTRCRGDTGEIYRIKAPAGWEPEAVSLDPISGEERVANLVVPERAAA